MIVLIDNYDSFTYNLYQALIALEETVVVFRHDKIMVSEALQLNPTALVLSPGPGRPEEAGISIELIKAAAQKQIPLLGVCLGHQAIVQAFGGTVVSAPEIVHGKAEMIFHRRSGIYRQLPLPFAAGRYHSLIADKTTFPAALQIEAESKEGLIMGLRHKQLPIFGVQFHPESILTPQGNQLLKNFVSLSAPYVTTPQH